MYVENLYNRKRLFLLKSHKTFVDRPGPQGEFTGFLQTL